MITITAILEVKEGQEEVMRKGLLKVAENVKKNEPDTVSFFISQNLTNSKIFTVHERFRSKEPMDKHNHSAVVSNFYETVQAVLEKKILITSNEIYQESKIE